jgi:CO/xanthine dehydrogenase Mo-binding subunit
LIFAIRLSNTLCCGLILARSIRPWELPNLLDEAKRLQARDDSGLFFVKDGDTAAALGTAAKVMEAGQDPAQYGIALLDGKGKNDGGAQRLRNTLLAAMGLAGHGTRQPPKGEGMGVARVSSQERATAGWTACVAHVAVAPSGEVKVKKLTVATDVGTQVHPDNIRAQVEGAAL